MLEYLFSMVIEAYKYLTNRRTGSESGKIYPSDRKRKAVDIQRPARPSKVMAMGNEEYKVDSFGFVHPLMSLFRIYQMKPNSHLRKVMFHRKLLSERPMKVKKTWMTNS